MRVRRETPADYAALYGFVKTAFATAKVSDGTEQDFVNKLRAGGNYLPELALVLEEDGEILGHIMLTRLAVKGRENLKMLLLAPLAVRLDRRGEGLGAKLAREALKRASELGYEAVALVGDPAYYRRFGFARMDGFGLTCDAKIPPRYALALALKPGALEGPAGYIDFLG